MCAHPFEQKLRHQQFQYSICCYTVRENNKPKNITERSCKTTNLSTSFFFPTKPYNCSMYFWPFTKIHPHRCYAAQLRITWNLMQYAYGFHTVFSLPCMHTSVNTLVELDQQMRFHACRILPYLRLLGTDLRKTDKSQLIFPTDTVHGCCI